MTKGDYVFSTGYKEKMTVISGAMTIQDSDSEASTSYIAGESFYVAAKSSFNVRVASDTSYLCLYG